MENIALISVIFMWFILIIGFGLMAWRTHKTSKIKEQD